MIYESNDIDQANDSNRLRPIEEFRWDQQKVIKPVKKIAISIRVDRDVLAWFRQQSDHHGFKGYQSYINAVLRSYYEAHQLDPSLDLKTNGSKNNHN